MRYVTHRPFPENGGVSRAKGMTFLITILLLLTIIPIDDASGDGPGSNPLLVDVGAVLDGQPFSFVYSGYNFSGMKLYNNTDGVVMVNFSYPGNSMVLLDNRKIGSLTQDENATYILTMGAGPDVELRYQGIDGLGVTVEKYDGGDLGIPDGGAFISSNTEAYGGTYRASYHFLGNQSYSISTNMSSNISFLGVVDETIVALGNGSANFSLPASAGAGAVKLMLFSNNQEYFDLQVNVSDYMYGNGSIPDNILPGITVDDGLITISFEDPNGYDDYIGGCNIWLPNDIEVAENVTFGYAIEDEYPYLNITRKNWDVSAILDKYTGKIEKDMGMIYEYITASYAIELDNPQSYTIELVYPSPLDYWIIQYTLEEVIYDTLTIDEDGDGFPHVEFLAHDVFVQFIDNGTNFTIVEGNPYHLTPAYFSGNQPDDDETLPMVPNQAADRDEDNLSLNFEVYYSGTDPTNANSDGIGLDDWLDVFEASTNDTDGDGLNDSYEVEIGTNPLKRDTDNDYFIDGAEKAYWEWMGYNVTDDIDDGGEHFLNDSNSDFGDSVYGEELNASVWYDLNYPLLVWDNDTFFGVDYYELDGIEVLRTLTNPAEFDSDDDGFADGGEVLYWKTQGLDGADSDGDGIINVMDADSDGDGLSDGFEIYSFLNWTNITEIEKITFYSIWECYYLYIMNLSEDNLTEYYPFNLAPSFQDYEFMNYLNQSLQKPLPMVLPASADTDDDGLSDYYEFYYPDVAINPNGSISFGAIYEDSPIFNASQFSLPNPFWNDTDLDGFLDGQEYDWGYSVVFPDTDFDLIPDSIEDADGDGIKDATETGAKLWDSDSDVMDDGYEVLYGFDPLDPDDAMYDNDTDGYDFDRNGSVAGSEQFFNYEEYLARTDPFDSDTDDDGMNDGFEAYYELDPKNDIDADYDNDDDGIGWYGYKGINNPLTNLEEYNLNTDPNDNDTDDDQLPDGWEVHFYLDPLDADDADDDTDNDGLDNLEEYTNELYPNNNDTDGDEMHDGWEYEYDLEPNWPNGDEDEDEDGVPNYNEFIEDSDPTSSDTDSDGMPDGFEYAYGLDLTTDDTEGDLDNDDNGTYGNMNNFEEFEYGTDPNNHDSDGDGLWDGDDFLPLSADSDGDGIPDSLEGDLNENEILDPDESSPTDADTDDDGLWDGVFSIVDEEYWYIGEQTYGTYPNQDDTDDDGLSDYVEIMTHFSPPLNADIDGDGLNDYAEIMTYQTHPRLKDSDGDGYDDDVEIAYGMEPSLTENGEDSDSDGVTDDEDILPTGDGKITILIKEIIALKDNDNRDLETQIRVIDKNKNEKHGKITHQSNDNYVRAYNTVTFNVPDDSEVINIRIRVVDRDMWPNPDDQLNLIPSRDMNDLHINFDLTTGWWCGGRGTEGPGTGCTDTNGYGFSKGGTGNDNDKAAIWFDIWATADGDGDGLSYPAEKYWGTKPNDANTDGDSYGVNDRFEAIYGFDPDGDQGDDYNNDDDEDGIKFKDEYKFGGIPGQKDIFVEVDWMDEIEIPLPPNTIGCNHKLKDESLTHLVRPFAKHELALHIDDGGETSPHAKYFGGGGEELPHEYLTYLSKGISSHNYWDEDDNSEYDAPEHDDDFYDYKYGEDNNFNGLLDQGEDEFIEVNNIIDSNFDYSRKDVYHYCLFVHKIKWWDYNDEVWKSTGVLGVAEVNGNDMMIRDETIYNIFWDNEKRDAAIFMHELGHNLCLPDVENSDSVMNEPFNMNTLTLDYTNYEWSLVINNLDNCFNDPSWST